MSLCRVARAGVRGVCVGCVRVARVGCVRGVRVVNPDGGFQGVWRVCVCHSCTCDMRDTCTTATGISQESAVQTLRGGREPRRKFLEERTRDTRRPRFRRGRNRRLLPPGAKSATFWGGPKSATFATLANRRLLSRGEKGARRLF